MELSPEIKKLEPGESYTIEILDENGFSKISPWGLAIPPLRLTCEKFHNAKRLSWDYKSFSDFIYESCANGVSTERFDNWLFEETGLRGFCLKFLMTDKEKYAKLNEERLEYNRNSVKMIQDLDSAKKDYDQLELKMMELKQRSRMGVLARLDPEFREKTEQKITGNIATIVIPEKDSEE